MLSLMIQQKLMTLTVMELVTMRMLSRQTRLRQPIPTVMGLETMRMYFQTIHQRQLILMAILLEIMVIIVQQLQILIKLTLTQMEPVMSVMQTKMVTRWRMRLIIAH